LANAAELPKMLPLVHTASWSSTLFAQPDATGTASIDINNCQVTGGLHGNIAAGGGIRFDDPAESLCGGDFSTIAVPAGIDAAVHLVFDDGKTHASYWIDPMGAVSAGHSVRIGKLVNDAKLGTYLNLWCSSPSGVTVTVYDYKGVEIGQQYIDVLPPVTQRKVSVPFAVGAISIVAGANCGGCQDVPAVYGFLSVSDSAGGNAEVIPFK
jgi:hypothetical protein